MRIFIASPDNSFRLALMLLLESEPNMVVSGMTDRADGLLVALEALHPQVLLLDWRLAGEHSIALIDAISRMANAPSLIVLSSDQQMKISTLAAGADVFIDKFSPPSLLLPALRKLSPIGS